MRRRSTSRSGSGWLVLLCLLGLLYVVVSNASQSAALGHGPDAGLSGGSDSCSSLAQAADYVALARCDASAVGISADVFERQIRTESHFNPRALSPAGAVGIAQFMPATAAGLGINPWNPIASLLAAARLMASYLHQYGGDYAKALAAYNAGSATVASAVHRGGSSWRLWLPHETQGYICIILQECS